VRVKNTVAPAFGLEVPSLTVDEACHNTCDTPLMTFTVYDARIRPHTEWTCLSVRRVQSYLFSENINPRTINGRCQFWKEDQGHAGLPSLLLLRLCKVPLHRSHDSVT